MRIGFIGLGNVGGKLAGSLLRNGFELTVANLKRVQERLGRDRVSALHTTTSGALDRVEEIIDEYLKLDFMNSINNKFLKIPKQCLLLFIIDISNKKNIPTTQKSNPSGFTRYAKAKNIEENPNSLTYEF